MDLSNLLSVEAILPSLRCGSKKQLLQILSSHAARLTNQPERMIFDILLERERLGSTGVGSGVAIPHGKLVKLNRIAGVFAKLEKPIEFDAADDRPVDLVFLMLAPETDGADHLKALSKIARLLRDELVLEKIRASNASDAIFALLTGYAESHAA